MHLKIWIRVHVFVVIIKLFWIFCGKIVKKSINRRKILCWTTLLIEVCVKNYFLQSKMQNKFKFLYIETKTLRAFKLILHFWSEKIIFLRKLQLAKLFSIKFSVDSCYLFHDFKAKNLTKFDYYNENMYTNSYF